MESTANDRHHEQTRKRSHSPHGDDDRSNSRRKHHHHHHHHHHHGHHRSRESAPVRLPYGREPLRKGDFEKYQPLFAEYLDVQKQIYLEDLSEVEVKGRFKSFLGKWNRRELAEGWYDPALLARAVERSRAAAAAAEGEDHRTTNRSVARVLSKNAIKDDLEKVDLEDDGEEDDDDYGPTLPQKRAGPIIPSLQDLQHREELRDEERTTARADRRHALAHDRNVQKERLDELAPRADPGSRERQLEKKREVTVANRSFGEAKEAGMEEVGERELMGGDDEGGIAGYKAKLKAREKIKNEREIRKEEVLRARAAEREERIAAHRMKEDRTMEMLRGLARERFG